MQESLIGSRFVSPYRWRDRSKGEITPTLTGTAHVTGETMLHLDPRIRSAGAFVRECVRRTPVGGLPPGRAWKSRSY